MVKLFVDHGCMLKYDYQGRGKQNFTNESAMPPSDNQRPAHLTGGFHLLIWIVCKLLSQCI